MIWEFLLQILLFHDVSSPLLYAITNHNDFVIEMTSMLEQDETAMTADCCCIYRVPNDIRELKEDSFTPKAVSIGPFHYGQQRLQNMEKYITDYINIMNFLINTSNDVDLLVQEGVIIYRLGEANSVANLFNSLWKYVTHVDFNSHYLHICKDLNAFCKCPWNNMKATLRHDYCKTPWQTAASIAGIMILILTLIIQAVYSIVQVVQQNKPKLIT